MYYQHQDKKAWLGPIQAFSAKGNDVFNFANGSVRKVPKCKVQLCEAELVESEGENSNLEEENKEG